MQMSQQLLERFKLRFVQTFIRGSEQGHLTDLLLCEVDTAAGKNLNSNLDEFLKRW